MDKGKQKAIWDAAAHSIYMDVCVEEVRENHRAIGNTTLSDVGQANLFTKFNERSGRNYCNIIYFMRFAVRFRVHIRHETDQNN